MVEEVFDERGRRASWASTKAGLRDDPLRLARAGLPGVRRRPARCSARRPAKYGIELPDRQLACAPVDSPEGQQYLGAMRAAANYAWANRQLLMWQAREIFAEFFGRSWESLQMDLVYDVAHNIAKMEQHTIDGRQDDRSACIARGPPGRFPPATPRCPTAYRAIGQPVIIPGDMGRASWVLVGQPGSMEQTFGTTCHGAGRVMSRTAAIEHAKGRRIDPESADKAGSSPGCAAGRAWPRSSPPPTRTSAWSVDVVHRRPGGESRQAAADRRGQGVRLRDTFGLPWVRLRVVDRGVTR